MADKKFIRDLNSLIRINERKRLKTPPSRPAISGGVGIATMGDETITEEYMYISHYGGGIWNDTYKYDKDGGAPVFVFSYPTGYPSRNIAYAFGDKFKIDANDVSANVLRNNDIIIAPPLGDAQNVSGIAAISTGLLVLGDSGSVSFYSYSGDYSHSVTPAALTSGASFLFANDRIMATYYDDLTAVISDHSGTQLTLVTSTESSQDLPAICRDAFLIPVYHATNLVAKIYNNLGVLVGTYDFGVNANVSTIGMTSDRIFITKTADSPALGTVEIYAHTLGFTGLDVTTATLGALLHTVNTPQTGDYTVWNTGQSSSMDAALFR